MKLLQNMAGNFLSMAPQEAKKFAQQLLESADKCLTAEAGRGAGFVQTIVIQEDRNSKSKGVSFLDTIFVGVSVSHIDVHPTLEADIQPRESWIQNIRREDVNVQKGHRS